MSAEIAAARQPYLHAAWLVDIGEDAGIRDLTGEDLRRKRLHAEYAVERYWRDARLTKIFEGTSEIQRRVIADRLYERTPCGVNVPRAGGYSPRMGIMSKVVKIGIAKKLYDEARKPHNQQKAKDAYAKFQASRSNRGTGPQQP